MSLNCKATFKPYESPDNRCPKQLPTQTCIYTAQGIVMCNARGNEEANVVTNIDLNIYQPYYHQTIDKMFPLQQPKHFNQTNN